MAGFLEKYLGILFDGEVTVKEGLFIAIGIMVVLIFLTVLINSIIGIVNRSKRKKTAIFSNKKNKYKSRLGKKNIKY